MHSYISNSKGTRWVRSWLLALIIAALSLGTMELLWRSNDHRPNIVDDRSLWAMERNKIGKSKNEIALLGSSRMQSDISIETLQRLAPDYSIINLSADSTCANAVLRDLAGDSTFRGTAILETTSECLMFGDQPKLSQQFYVDYFHKTYNLNKKLNRHIATFVQKNLTVVDPHLNLIKVVGDLVIKKKWRGPNSLTTYENRSRSVDYNRPDIASYKAKRLQKVVTHYRKLAPDITEEALIANISDLENAVKVIQSRGGKVVFVRFPVSGEHWGLDEQYFPRIIYWDTIIPNTSATMLHFKDIDGMNTLECPDTSHLNASDRETFTIQLFNELIRNKMI